MARNPSFRSSTPGLLHDDICGNLFLDCRVGRLLLEIFVTTWSGYELDGVRHTGKSAYVMMFIYISTKFVQTLRCAKNRKNTHDPIVMQGSITPSFVLKPIHTVYVSTLGGWISSDKLSLTATNTPPNRTFINVSVKLCHDGLTERINGMCVDLANGRVGRLE